MPSIEYSPNSRAGCQGCHSKIPEGKVRVGSKSQSTRGDMLTKYWHAGCYTNRKDFTKLAGFWMLKKDDKKTFLSESQKKHFFPEDFIDVSKIVAAPGAENENGNKRESLGDDEKVAKKSKTDVKDKSILSTVLSVTGLKFADVEASNGEEVTLIREPNNPYDKNAIRVDSGGEKVGHISKDQAVKVALILDKLKDAIAKKSVVVSAKIVSAGDGYKQSLQLDIIQK